MKRLLMSIMLVLMLVSCGIGSNEMTTDRAYKSLLGFTLTDPDFLEYDKGRSMGEVTGIIETSENKIEILFTVLNVPCDYMCNPDKWRQASNGKALAFSTTEGKWILDCIQYENYYGSLMLGRQSCNLNRDMDEMAKGAISSTGNEAVVDANAGNDELAPQGEVDANAGNDELAPQGEVDAKNIDESAINTPVIESPFQAGELLDINDMPQQNFCGGHHHGLALNADGTVTAWGNNNLGQTNVPSGLDSIEGVYCIGDTSYAISFGRVVAWGGNQSGIRDIPTELMNKPANAASGVHKIIGSKYWDGNYSYAIALKRDGTLVGWGDNTYGVLNIPTGLNDVVDISGGFEHVIALKSDGTLVGWGTDNYATYESGHNLAPLSTITGVTLSPMSTLTGVTAISTGFAHSMALIWDGTVVMWGNNYLGQSRVPNGLTDVKQIFTGMYYSIALKKDGTVVGWGYDEYGQLQVTDLVGVTEISGTPSTSFMLLADGNLVGRGLNDFGEIPVGISIR